MHLALLLVTALCSPALGQYFISSSSVDGGGYMFSAGGGYTLGGTAGQCDAHSSFGGVYMLSGGFWALAAPSGPSCMATAAPLADASTPDMGFGRKNRYVSIVPGNPLEQTALRIEGATWSAWVGPPVEYTENAGKLYPSEAPGFPTFWAATLQCDAYFTDWTNYPMVHIYHEAIMPVNTYVVQAIHESCNGAVESSYSLPLETLMSDWGDVVETCPLIPCGPPDGVVNVTSDVTAVLNKFKNLVGAPVKARSDLDLATPDQKINISDVTIALDAFRGMPDPYPPAPDPCTAAAEAAQMEVASLPYDDLDFAPAATIELVPSRTELQPGEAVAVDVLLSGAFDVRNYQVTLVVDGGDSGRLHGEDLRIDAQRADFIFGYGSMLSAVDHPGDRIGAVLVSGGVDVVDPAYLGTFTLRATEDASGTFSVYAALENHGSMLNSSDNQQIRFSSPAAEIEVNSSRFPHRSSK